MGHSNLLDSLRLDALREKSERIAIEMTPEDMRAPLGTRQETCPEHGVYESTGVRYLRSREIWTRCPDCEERRQADEAKAKAEAAARQAQAEIEYLMDQAAIPARFAGRSLDNFKAATPQQLSALSIAREYAENFERHSEKGDMLVFMGSPGTGKSHLATSILQALMPKRCGLYVTCMGMIRAIRATWRKDSEKSEAEVLSMLESVPLLVIDEIGVQYDTDGEKTLIFEVLDRRYRQLMPTILLTNQSKSGLKDFLGERAFDRLTETAKWVVFDWPSYRAQARKEAA